MRRDVMAVMVLQAAVAGPAAAASDAAPEIASQLEEIVVTARRTAETLQRVPLSMSAISAEDLAERSIESLSDVGQTVPNLLFGERGASGRGSAVVYIRGVGQADVRPTYDPAVGIYVDGVFLGRMQGNDLDTMDVERVEVLRGPQGTLFGKNTSGGALNIVTRQPDLENYGGKVQLTAGSRSRFDALGSVNIPLVADKAALLVAASHRTQDGYGTRADGQDMGISIPIRAIRRTSAILGRTRWMPGSKAIAFLGQNDEGINGVFVQDFVPGKDTTATRREFGGFDRERATESFGISPDGTILTVAGWEQLFSLFSVEGVPGVTKPNAQKES